MMKSILLATFAAFTLLGTSPASAAPPQCSSICTATTPCYNPCTWGVLITTCRNYGTCRGLALAPTTDAPEQACALPKAEPAPAPAATSPAAKPAVASARR
ncbi:MAG: hypothetical protein R3B48_07970 [Kofleriaceae bacterium]